MSTELINEIELIRHCDTLGFDCDYRQQTESTNADALHYYQTHQRPVVAVSESQTAGRGRRGRTWLSPFARNIYCSIGLEKSLPASGQGLLSIVTGIALCRSLRELLDCEVRLKWPNDLLFEGAKLGGILIESRPLETDRFFFVIGFGLNVKMTDEELGSIPQAASSLQHLSKTAVDRQEVLLRCIEAVVSDVTKFDATTTTDVMREFTHFDACLNQSVEVISSGERVRGVCLGISDQGLLLLQTDSGTRSFSSAEVSLRKVNA
ncbi:MAG: biotin--[acetyl-CoA-carboxylase] ligase [Pseudomonadota bacterium]